MNSTITAYAELNADSVAPWTRDDIWLLSAVDDGPRPRLQRNRTRSQECKSTRHRTCFTTPCNCSCHQLKPEEILQQADTIRMRRIQRYHLRRDSALKLIRIVEASGGVFRMDGQKVIVAPRAAAMPVQAQLIAHKQEIVSLLLRDDCTAPEFMADLAAMPDLKNRGKSAAQMRALSGMNSLATEFGGMN